jgi:hypothetical protein
MAADAAEQLYVHMLLELSIPFSHTLFSLLLYISIVHRKEENIFALAYRSVNR